MANGREVVFGGKKMRSQIGVDFVGNLSEQTVKGATKFLLTKFLRFPMFGLFLLMARQKIRLAINLRMMGRLMRNGLINHLLSQFLQSLPLSFSQWFLGSWCLRWFSKGVMAARFAALMDFLGFLVVGQGRNVGNFRVKVVVSCFGVMWGFGLMRLRCVHMGVLFSLRVLQSRIVVSLRVNVAL